MAIIKSKHAGNFTVLPNEIFNSDLSAQAIGILAYMLSLPSDWVLYKENIRDKFNIGRDGMRSIIKELEVKGYFLSVQNRNAKGVFEYDYIVYDKPFNGEAPILQHTQPHTDYPLTVEPPTDEPPTDSPQVDNPPPTKETLILNTNNTKDILPDAISEPIKVIFDENKFVGLFNFLTGKRIRILDDKSKKQIKKLLEKGYTKEDIKKAIENCNKDEYHIKNPKYLTPEFITREDKFVMYLSASDTKVELPADWFHNQHLTPEQWALLTKEQRTNKENNDTRLKMGI